MCIEAAFGETGSTCDHIDQRISGIDSVLELSTSSVVKSIGALLKVYLEGKPLKEVELSGETGPVYYMLITIDIKSQPKKYASFLSDFKETFGFVAPVGSMGVTKDGVEPVPFGSQSPPGARRPQAQYNPLFSGSGLNPYDEGLGISPPSATVYPS